jgi:hypothetical protein
MEYRRMNEYDFRYGAFKYTIITDKKDNIISVDEYHLPTNTLVTYNSNNSNWYEVEAYFSNLINIYNEQYG